MSSHPPPSLPKSKYLWPIPKIPGTPLAPNDPAVLHLSDHIADITSSTPGFPSSSASNNNNSFPGSQPVSFTRKSIKDLQERNFWVCEKSDGVRVLVLIVWNGINNEPETYIIDRKNTYYQLSGSGNSNSGLIFPHHDPRHQVRPNSLGAINTTLIDGELVYDAVPTSSEVEEGLFQHSHSLEGRNEEEIWKGKERRLRLYAFDCMIYDGVGLMGSSLQSRYGRLKSWLIAPFHAHLAKQPAEIRNAQPFELVCKKMELADGIQAVMDVHIPRLQHAYDGLIFTCAETSYVKGKTDENIMKWKPPEENTVDFELELRFPPSEENPREVDLLKKPVFVLNVWKGGDRKDFFDVMEVEDTTWEEWKASGEQFDDRVVECTWSASRNSWEFMRFRPDKTNGNYESVVYKVIDSIRDGVSLADLQSHCPAIRARRKEREAAGRMKPNPALAPQQISASNRSGVPPQAAAGMGGYSTQGYGGQGMMPAPVVPMLRR